MRSGSSGSESAPFFHRYSRSSAEIRDGVGLMNAGSSKLGRLSEWRCGKVDDVDEFVESECDSEGREACEEANDARRRLCV